MVKWQCLGKTLIDCFVIFLTIVITAIIIGIIMAIWIILVERIGDENATMIFGGLLIASFSLAFIWDNYEARCGGME